jgi:hypothetical protein
MIDDLSQTLRTILTRGMPEPLKSAEIVFDRPADPFTPQKTTVDLFLYDIREDLELRSNEPVIERKNGQVTTHRPPLRVACSYLVTAWPGSLRGDEAVLLEQRLLSQTLQVLSGQPTIDPKLLQGSLKGQEPPLPLVTALVDPQKNFSEFWTALGNKLRPSLTVRVTISLADVLAFETEHMVTASELYLGERTSPDEEKIVPATLEELILIGIGGRVTNAENVPVSGATVTLKELELRTTTDVEGRYKLSVRQPGPYTLRVQKGERVKEASITVEAGSQIEVQLT